MKKNFFLFLSLLFIIISCTRNDENAVDETTNQTSFFNLKVGNKWVYKTFSRPDFTSEFIFNGKIDSLEIVGEVSLNNKNYSKIKHIQRNINAPNNNTENSEYYEYWRVNENGHLLKLSSYYFDLGNDIKAKVVHPGKDNSYAYNDLSFENEGTMIYKLYPKTIITVENQSYEVSPYNGQFTPNVENSGLLPKLTEYNYKENVGLVKSVCHSLYGTSNYEERLVSYDLK